MQPSTANPANLPLVAEDASIRTTMEVIDRFAKGIAIVVDDVGHLLATVTDGDVRRAILAGVNLDQPVSRLQKPEQPRPVVASNKTTESELLTLMEQHSIRQIPLLDEAGQSAGWPSTRTP